IGAGSSVGAGQASPDTVAGPSNDPGRLGNPAPARAGSVPQRSAGQRERLGGVRTLPPVLSVQLGEQWGECGRGYLACCSAWWRAAGASGGLAERRDGREAASWFAVLLPALCPFGDVGQRRGGGEPDPLVQAADRHGDRGRSQG